MPERRESLVRDRRGLSSVVGKLYELVIVLGFVGVVTASLYGSVVPGYRTATGAELGDRALATAAERVEAAVPPSGVTGRRTLAVDLPATLAGAPYRIRAVNDSALVLQHPAETVGGRMPLALPERVRRVNGTWNSTDRPVVEVVDGADGVTVRLEARR
ncbi:MAG: hypothetical protein ABEJ22_05665 [Haloferacaceae archaeon]